MTLSTSSSTSTSSSPPSLPYSHFQRSHVPLHVSPPQQSGDMGIFSVQYALGASVFADCNAKCPAHAVHRIQPRRMKSNYRRKWRVTPLPRDTDVCQTVSCLRSRIRTFPTRTSSDMLLRALLARSRSFPRMSVHGLRSSRRWEAFYDTGSILGSAWARRSYWGCTQPFSCMPRS